MQSAQVDREGRSPRLVVGREKELDGREVAEGRRVDRKVLVRRRKGRGTAPAAEVQDGTVDRTNPVSGGRRALRTAHRSPVQKHLISSSHCQRLQPINSRRSDLASPRNPLLGPSHARALLRRPLRPLDGQSLGDPGNLVRPFLPNLVARLLALLVRRRSPDAHPRCCGRLEAAGAVGNRCDGAQG